MSPHSGRCIASLLGLCEPHIIVKAAVSRTTTCLNNTPQVFLDEKDMCIAFGAQPPLITMASTLSEETYIGACGLPNLICEAGMNWISPISTTDGLALDPSHHVERRTTSTSRALGATSLFSDCIAQRNFDSMSFLV
eukprot:2020491-Amphidinium_carterae.2